MKINLQVQFEDNSSKEITANAADLVAFEDKYDISISRLGADAKLGHLLFLAWHSEHRTKATDKPYELWLEGVSSIGDSPEDPKSKA
jgi:hypothetical protein